MSFETLCDCASAEFDLVHAYLAQSDELIAKALSLSEVAQIARAEVRARDILLNKWLLRAKEGAHAAGARFASTGHLGSALEAMDEAMAKWQKDVLAPFSLELHTIYKLARVAGAKKASGDTTASLSYNTPEFDVLKPAPVKKAKTVVHFDLYDESALSALDADQMFWIGEHYQKQVRDTIRFTAQNEIVLRGLGRREAGKALEQGLLKSMKHLKIPGGYHGRADHYFEGVVANAATTGRVRGQIRSFMDYGVTRYLLSNPMDRRTSAICAHLNGTVYTIEHAKNQIESEAGAVDPAHIKSVHPWLPFSEIQKLSPKGGKDANVKALAAKGISLPPFHFRCRTTVDIDPGSGAYEPLTPAEVKTIPKPPKPKPKPKPKAKPIPKPSVAPKPHLEATLPPTPPKPTAAAKKWWNGLPTFKKNAVERWTGVSYHDLRYMDKVGAEFAGADEFETYFTTKEAKRDYYALKDALGHAPPMPEGVKLYRGMRIPVKDAERMFQEGGSLELDAMSSFSKEASVAQDFSASFGKNSAAVVLEVETDGEMASADISMMNRAEQEVVVGKGEKFRLEKVTREVTPEGVTKIHVRMKRIPPSEVEFDAPPASIGRPAAKSGAEWKAGLTRDEENALDGWVTTGQYTDLRELDKKGVENFSSVFYSEYEDPADARKDYEHLMKALEKTPKLEGGTTLSRGIVLTNEEAKAFKRGAEMELDALSSFSKDSKVPFDFLGSGGGGTTNVVIEAQADAGMEAFDISAFNPDEQEVLLPKGSRFKMKSVTWKKAKGPNGDYPYMLVKVERIAA